MRHSALIGFVVIVTVLPWENKDHLQLNGVHCYELDVTKNDSVQSLKKNVHKLTDGRLSVLVNNAYVLPLLQSGAFNEAKF